MSFTMIHRFALSSLVVLTLAGAGAYFAPAQEPHKTPGAELKEIVDPTQPVLGPEQTMLDAVAPFRRILWVTRWDYRTPEDVRQICYNAAAGRFTDILFQVRGEGTVFYKSDLEPWAWELTGRTPAATGRDPGWDPLALAIQEGAKYGLRVHAYLNVLPGWGQKQTAPPYTGQLYSVHRSWFMVDAAGNRMNPANWYAFLEPGLEEVRLHVTKVFADVARRYKVAGLHMDYIRYPMEKGDYGYTPRVVDDFRALVGGEPKRRPDEWDAFRRQHVTDLVVGIRQAVQQINPKLELTAAVLADRTKALRAHQDALTWVREGYVDAILPMAYTDDLDLFSDYLKAYQDEPIRKRTWPGILVEKGKAREQIEMTIQGDFPAVAVFAYGEVFSGHRQGAQARAIYEKFMELAKRQ
ncbi:MAG TPA: family 10 glycosylhydrolase [Candidatus Sumerlaeota bacterium]|nr:MAG: hypothetical protein BWZ08_00028 [candidate division BRC1 bacterium ADurb.BinA292]HOR27355.1 family 10 glycosylhydrolase [Candidatus Sumerlaeota bacterium]HPK03176.1 family 10 glycosylhydrolase [Candidatus Sumerlaeota bacterium]